MEGGGANLNKHRKEGKPAGAVDNKNSHEQQMAVAVRVDVLIAMLDGA